MSDITGGAAKFGASVWIARADQVMVKSGPGGWTAASAPGRLDALHAFDGQRVVGDGDVVLTHCNAGALATAGFGTALGVVRAAWEEGKKISVVADETRPRGQGAKLTAWELSRDGLPPVTVIADTAAGHYLRRGMVRKVGVGADRIAANGDVANKIGTYQVAVLAHANRVPFYVAAPLSTFDPSLPSGDRIPIEERSAAEVTHPWGRRLTPAGVPAQNPAFDVTPARYVSGIITERGVLTAPYRRSIARCLAAGA